MSRQVHSGRNLSSATVGVAIQTFEEVAGLRGLLAEVLW
jgi:hypothetical protein